MTLHEVEYDYRIREGSSINLDIDPTLDQAEKELLVITELKAIYDDIEDIEILKIREI